MVVVSHGTRIRVSNMIPRQRLRSASATGVMFDVTWRSTLADRAFPDLPTRFYNAVVRPLHFAVFVTISETVEKHTNSIGFADSLVASSTKYDRGP